MAKNDGGPAFPVAGNPGMSLRDWFAGQAIPRLPFDPSAPHSVQAKQAYAMADAMIAERDK